MISLWTGIRRFRTWWTTFFWTPLVLELCRLAAARAPSSLARFPGECLPELIFRCGDHLSQHAFGLQMWSRELAAPVRGGSPTSPG